MWGNSALTCLLPTKVTKIKSVICFIYEIQAAYYAAGSVGGYRHDVRSPNAAVLASAAPSSLHDAL